MNINVARVWETADYAKVKNLCESDEGWYQVCRKKNLSVFTQSTEGSAYKMMKVVAKYPDVEPSVAYDVLHDSSYRARWDRHLVTQCYIGRINPNNDLGYYALSAVPPLRARDFVLQHSWFNTADEKMICGHSVCHEDYPPMKGYIRATATLSAYLIRPNYNDGGCEIFYVIHTDPKGNLPTMMVNRVTRSIAPKVVKRLHKACLDYPAWKAENRPHFKPWLYPEQQSELPSVDLSKCKPQEYAQEFADELDGSLLEDVDEQE
ncbi:START domain containing 14 [Trichostrongylus colubriformis]|uniref:START domain-containing protein 10 n=1 Tax=Trichostrongylus colubriformis TaxID=6319 RepID=A0AAN8ITR9_TRICO